MHRIEAYIRLGLIFVVIISILYLPILFKLKKKGISPTRQVSYIGLVCSIFLIVFATMLFMLISFDSTHTLFLLIGMKLDYISLLLRKFQISYYLFRLAFLFQQFIKVNEIYGRLCLLYF